MGVAAGAAADAQAAQVAALLSSYFSAINTLNYQAYIALLSPQKQQGMTLSQFNSGYASTKDSDETLQDISAGPDGSTVAAVTFTSHQDPANSINGSQSCTSWNISLYLVQGGNGYVIVKPPSSYHARYAAC